MPEDTSWYKLDNAAKIMPSTARGSDTRVFRLVCELKEEIDPAVLQEALDAVIEDFPYLNCCLRKGIFWYYLDARKETAQVYQDNRPPMKQIYYPGRKNLLYRVNYYKNRINLELFHALSDGTGGVAFLKALVRAYLIRKHHLDPDTVPQEEAPIDETTEDAFSRYYRTRKQRKKMKLKTGRNWLKEMFPEKAYHMIGQQDPNMESHVLEGTVSVDEVLRVAHEKNVTLGVLAVSVFIEAVIGEMKARDYTKPVVISVPVNLRQYYPTHTGRNFFGVFTVRFQPEDYDGTLESIMPCVEREFRENLTQEKIFRNMNSYAELENNWAVKVFPLAIKDLGVGGINHLIKQGVTTTVSNVGKVKAAPALEPYIEKFACFNTTDTTQMCIMSFGDRMTFGITSAFTDHAMPRRFFKRIEELGIKVTVAGNDYDILETDKEAVRAAKITVSPEENPYPYIPKPKVSRFSLIRTMYMSYAILLILLLAVRLIAGRGFFWMPVVMAAGFLCVLDIHLVLYYRNNFIKIFSVEMYLAMLICLGVNAFTGGYPWAINWTVPSAMIAVYVGSLIGGKATGRPLVEYILFLVLDSVISLLQMIPIALAWNTFRIPAVVSISFCLIFTLALICFNYRTMKAASERMFNI
ncbi:MAG: DUF6320 domain-containing protein [Eubacterium sp.]|nr:DUF6320 domain-containing protein [Eubacterium sp.]